MAEKVDMAAEQDGEDLVFDGERFIPGAGVGIAYEHWARYAFAAGLVGGREVLDAGCGEGYGSAFLASRALSVLGFDASAAAVDHARSRHAKSGARYERATVREFFAARAAASADTVVAFEILEHLPVEEQAVLLDGIGRVLRPDGFALISTPDKLLHTDAPLATSPFHVRELYRDEFEVELRKRFLQVRIFDQALFSGCVVAQPGAGDVRAVQMRWTDLQRSQGDCQIGLHPRGEYLVALVGNGKLPEAPPLVLADFSRKLLAEALAGQRAVTDRLARELEQARRAWETAMAESRRLFEQLTAERAAAEPRARAEAEQVRRELTRSLDDLRAQCEEEKARASGLAEDLARLRLQSELATRSLRQLRQARQGPAVRLKGLLDELRPLPKRRWLAQPRTAVVSMRQLSRHRSEARLIEKSGLFDPEFYLAEQRDVAKSGDDALQHFLRFGGEEGRDPHPLFSSSYYLQTYPDVGASGQNPLVHYLLHGWKEKRNPHPLFDTAFYLNQNPDVARAGVNPLSHYLEQGAAEGRDPSPLFDTRAYLREHPEAAAGGWNPIAHARRGGAVVPSLAGVQQSAALQRWRTEVCALPRRALVVDDTMLTPDRDSGSITTLELMKALQALGYAVTFVPHNMEYSERYATALEAAGFWVLTGRELPSVNALLELHGALFDLVVLCRVSAARHLIEPVQKKCPNAALIFETIDLHYLRLEREAALTGSEATRLEAESIRAVELDVIRRADVTLVHSAHEKEVLAGAVPDAIAYHLPYVLDLQERGPGFAPRRDLLFLGGFSHKPNVDAVLYFVREVFPLVRRDLPGVRFLIVGPNPTEEIKQLAAADIEVMGFVQDLAPVFHRCRMSVAPLRYGAGYKGKVAMSMAHGVPSVLSSVAAEGMELEHGVQILIADAPAAFAAEVVRLHRDQALWERLSRASVEFVATRFSPQAAREHLKTVLLPAGADPQERPQLPASAVAPPRAGTAVFPSRFMQALHERAGLRYQRTALVPHGVEFRHLPGQPRASRNELVQPGSLRLLVAGRVVDFKGVHTAIEALPAIVLQLPGLDVRLTIVGDTQDRVYLDRLRGLIAEHQLDGRVRFEPPRREDELFELFQQHDIYLFPSLFEPFALTLLLALEAGMPTVASAAGGNVDLVIDHRTGLLFPAGDARGLAEAAVELAVNPSLREALAEAGRAAAARYTLEAMVGRIESALAEAAGPGREPPRAGARP